jgi:hypothetical protein
MVDFLSIRQLAIQFRHSPISHRKQAMRVFVHLRQGIL